MKWPSWFRRAPECETHCWHEGFEFGLYESDETSTCCYCGKVRRRVWVRVPDSHHGPHFARSVQRWECE